MKKFFMATMVVALFGGLLLTSCVPSSESGSDMLIGKWALTGAKEEHNGQVVWEEYIGTELTQTYTFRADGTGSIGETTSSWRVDFVYTHKGKQLSLLFRSGSSSYTVDELTSSTLILSHSGHEYSAAVGEDPARDREYKETEIYTKIK